MTARMRQEVRDSDPAAVSTLLESTGVFNPAEIAIAGELVEETMQRGADSGYQFLFLDGDVGGLTGYSCFGRIPATESSFDLYWIAVAPAEQGKGLGFELLRESERLALGQGATRMYIDTSGRLQYAATRDFYERCDYSQAAVFQDFYAPGDAKIVYCRILSNDRP